MKLQNKINKNLFDFNDGISGLFISAKCKALTP